MNGRCVCLLCNESLAVYKEYNVRRHDDKHYARAHRNMSESEKKALSDKQTHSLLKEQQVFTTESRSNEAVTRASFVVAHKFTQESKSFSEGEFVKDCLLACSDILCPKERTKFDCVTLSRRHITRRVEEISADLHEQFKDECRDCICFSLALDESTDIKHTAQRLIFIRTIDFNFKLS